jgi:hypothetical protein
MFGDRVEMARISRHPEPVEVTADERGLPLSMLRKHRRYRVLGMSEHWRVIDEWWGEEVQRDYFRVETNSGHVFDIYHDVVSGRWYLSGLR